MIRLTSIQQLELLVSQRIEESVELEFKQQPPDAGKNDDLGRDLAAMANAGGGTIVYGIKEEDGRASQLNPFPLAKIAERIAMVAQTSLDEQLIITDIVALEASPGLGYLVVHVPLSERRPHLMKGLALTRSSRGNVPMTRQFRMSWGNLSPKPGR